MQSLDGRRRGVALLSVVFVASLGLGASAIERTPGGRVSAAGTPIILAQNAMPKATYSKEQATRGERRYMETCLDCHGEDLRGGLNGGAPIRGLAFLSKFTGAPASALFLFMSTQMPPESPGRFSDQTYADLMAFVMQMNGFDAGAPLPSDTDSLDKLVLEK